MPRGDRTGPYGGGPMTGRGAGYCAGYSTAGFANPGHGRGASYGGGFQGGGRGWRHCFYATGLPRWRRPAYPFPPPEGELAGLKEQATLLQNQLEALNTRIAELSIEPES
jgi:hypothetical protein